MPGRIHADQWVPIGVNGLEPAALDVVRSVENTLVVAGPGAGKTELLAQRACFLLQTGQCREPYKILAISFKRDAARNLAERVRLRCGSELSSRFHSYTFDAFSKGLVDRFGQALPERFKPTKDYAINFELAKWTIGNWVRDILPDTGSTLSVTAKQGINGEKLYDEFFIGRRLTMDAWENQPAMERASAELWRYMLKLDLPSEMTFPMLGRLAELALRHNPKILAALRTTYAYVFLDEFQDTSIAHYDLTVTAFSGSSAVVTAVGDNKQRVNKWAGALDGIFGLFQAEFDAGRVDLLMNYRSAPELVRVQSFVARAIDPTAPPAQAAKILAHGEQDGECLSLVFSTYELEAKLLAAMIDEWIRDDGLSPRDVCILTRQRPAHYAKLLQAELAELSIASRVENELQDLVAEPLTIYVMHVLRLVSAARAPESWAATIELLNDLRGSTTEREERVEAERLAQCVQALRAKLKLPPTDLEQVAEVVAEIVALVGADNLKAAFAQYGQGKFFAKTCMDIANELASRFSSQSLGTALDDLQGIGCLPIMTMHKSKGLEYHTVIFIGLEDAALKGFIKEPDEETCGFFVALSRAKHRAVFTFSERRPTYDRMNTQQRANIQPLYDVLKAAGVEPQHLG